MAAFLTNKQPSDSILTKYVPEISISAPSVTLALFVLAASLLRAQSTNASLTGRAADSSKGLIADAKILAPQFPPWLRG